MSTNHQWIKLRWYKLLRSPRVLAFTRPKDCAVEVKKWWYLALICEAYFAGGYLPADVGVLWKLADAQTEWFFKRHSGEVLACFERTPDGKRMYHPRILELLEDHEKKRSISEIKGASSLLSSLPDWVSKVLWTEFLQMRADTGKRIKRKSTEEKLIARLDKLRGEGHDPASTLTWSIANHYQGLWPEPAQQYRRGEIQVKPVQVGIFVPGSSTSRSWEELSEDERMETARGNIRYKFPIPDYMEPYAERVKQEASA